MTDNKDDIRSNPESDESVGNFNSVRYIGKRFAKADELIQKDILNLFQEKTVWTMDEIKKEMPDQPDRPVDTNVRQLCDQQGTGRGGNAKWVLKSGYISKK